MTVKYDQLRPAPSDTDAASASQSVSQSSGLYVPPETPDDGGKGGGPGGGVFVPYEDDDIEALPIATATTPISSASTESIPLAPVVAVLGFEDKETRMTFIRRVYSILAVQMLVTGGICAFMILHLPTQQYVLTHAWPINTSAIISLVLIVALGCYKVR
uniref:Uncharacterized protein n=1 Tax=Odontella aurita TaxID=265563 RepID=A0A7S4N6K1_9STRA|mmetsp:Transcript_50395/g.151775  ORF Transcript_50395/g.151775 Transcript_50395/m.151775 type:complete len:159 (+) Transcript_50395:238-714(+)